MKNDKEMTIGDVLKVSSAYWQSSTIHCGVKLDVFSHIGDHGATAKEVADKAKADERAVSMLLNALTALGLVYKNAELYSNSPLSREYLIKGKPAYSGYIIMHHYHLVDAWTQLDEAVRSGGAVEKRSYGVEQERESFLMGMYNIAMGIAPIIAQQIKLENRRHLLDLGGGPGTHAVFFCRENPDLKATIFDRPTTRDFAEKVVEHHGMVDRIRFMAGDFTKDQVGGPYDIAWLSQILHSNGPADCRKIIERTVAALEPGGLIMVHEFFLDETKTKPLFPALFSLNMLVNNGHGSSYSEQEIVEMLHAAGIGKIDRLSFQGPNDSYIICGTR